MDKLKIAKVENVDAIRGGQILRGTLHLTSHHLIYIGAAATAGPVSQQDGASKPRQREMWIAFPIIAFCIFRPTAPGSGFPSSIRLRCRDFTFITFNFGDERQARDAFDSIKALTCKLGSIEKLHAFSYRPPKHERDFNGWDLYDAKAEWRRQGISEKGLDRGWRISKINEDYSFSPTYPALLVVPTSISDNVLNYAGRYRSRTRLPALTYLHPVNNCSITRCAQPLTGLRGNRSIQDEKLVLACFTACGATEDPEHPSSQQSHSSPSSSQDDLPPPPPVDGEVDDTERLEDEIISATKAETKDTKPQVYGAQQHNLIVDARPTVNALAMQAVGLGSENMDNYKFATKVYLGIDNIHVMRESLAKVIEALKDGDVSPLPPNRELLAKSNWLKHIQGLLDGAALIARQVGIHHSHALIHCSDGWDRTSQLSALSQLLLDPYYRTFEGFMILVEKDWLSFGHMFQHRSGFLNSEKWFQTQNDGLAGTAIQPGGSDGRSDALENALQSAKRFFNKNNQSTESMADLDSDMLPEDSPKARKGAKDADGATKPKETSPVFHQFLDATYQLLRQHPTRFEFNERFLRRLLYHLYSCQYGTFLYNSEKARLDARVRERTRSVWDYFLCRREEFINKDFDGEIDDNKRGHERLIFPDLSKLRWWHELFGRTDEEMNGPSNPVVERYLAPSPKPPLQSQSIMTGTESTSVATGVGTSRKITDGAVSGFASIKEGISGLTLGKAKNSPRARSPAAKKQAMEVEMQ